MIVKSMSRKEPSFGQLVGYIDRGASQKTWRIRHNLLARDPEHIRDEFVQNGDLLARRKNGVYLYHEIISITRAEGISLERQKARLREIAERYISERCPDNLVFGNLHDDQKHSLHYHLIISANPAGEAKRLRLSKGRFREIQVQLERHVLETMPELEQSTAIDKSRERDRLEETRKEQAEVTRNPGDIAEQVQAALTGSTDRTGLRLKLEALGMELYIRGNTPGVIDRASGKKHRLKTLGLHLRESFEALPEHKPTETREKPAPEGEKEKGAEVEALPEPQRHQSPQQNHEEQKSEWKAELEQLRQHHEETRQVETERSNTLLREIKALVRFAVSDTLRGIRSRALKMLERLNLKSKQYEHERLRRDPNHQRDS